MKFWPFGKKDASAQASSVSDRADLIAIRKRIIQLVFIIALVLGSLAYFSSIFPLIQSQSWLVAGVQTFVYGGLIILTLADKLSLTARTLGLLFIILTLAVAEMLEMGLLGEGRIFMITFALMAMILLDFRQALALIALSLVIILIIAGLMTSGLLPPPDLTKIDDSTKILEWVTGTVIYLLVTGLVSVALITLVRGMQGAMVRQAGLARDLELERAALEDRVLDRTVAVQQRASMMQVVANFSHEIQALHTREEMLALLINTFQQELQIKDIGAFLPENEGRSYRLTTSAGALVQEIMNASGTTWTKQPGTLAFLFDRDETQVLRNAGEHSVYFHQPGLSGIYAIILLPLRSAELHPGAVCLFFEDEPDTDEGQIQIYRSLADQAAIALEKAALLASLQKNLEELKVSGREMTRKNWRGYIKSSRQAFSLRYTREKFEPGGQRSQSASQAFNERRVVIHKNNERGGSTVAIPILLRDEPLGVIDVHFANDQVPENLVSLIESATKRLALALDNARLMDQMQNRVERESAISALTARIRASSDVNGILKAAAAEIGNSFGASEVLVQLRTDDAIRSQSVENS